MAQKSSAEDSIGLLREDLVSEVTRRRVSMATREEKIAEKSDVAGEVGSPLGVEKAVTPSKTDLAVPPAPPPSPAADPAAPKQVQLNSSRGDS